MADAPIPRPEVRGIVLVTRNGRLVGVMPIETPLPAAKADSAGDDKEQSESSPAPAGEDPL